MIRVRVGALRQVVPESLSFCWAVIRDYEDLPDAELEMELVAAVVHCRRCGDAAAVTSRWSLVCPRCESPDIDVLSGDELLVTSLDVS